MTDAIFTAAVVVASLGFLAVMALLVALSGFVDPPRFLTTTKPARHHVCVSHVTMRKRHHDWDQRGEL